MVKGMLTQQVMQVVSAEMFGGDDGQQAHRARPAPARRTQVASRPGRRAAARHAGSRAASTRRCRPRSATPAGPARGLAMPFTTHDQSMSSGPAAQGYNPYAHAFSGMGVQFILFMAVNMGIGILLSRRTGVWDRVLAAPVTLPQVVLARAVSAAIIAFGLLCAIFAGGGAGLRRAHRPACRASSAVAAVLRHADRRLRPVDRRLRQDPGSGARHRHVRHPDAW